MSLSDKIVCSKVPCSDDKHKDGLKVEYVKQAVKELNEGAHIMLDGVEFLIIRKKRFNEIFGEKLI